MYNFADELSPKDIAEHYVSEYRGSKPMSVDRVLAGLVMFNKQQPNKLIRFRNCFMMHVQSTPSRKYILVINGNDSRRTLVDCMLYALQLGKESKSLKVVTFLFNSGDYSEAPNLFGDSASLDPSEEQDSLTVDVKALTKMAKKSKA